MKGPVASVWMLTQTFSAQLTRLQKASDEPKSEGDLLGIAFAEKRFVFIPWRELVILPNLFFIHAKHLWEMIERTQTTKNSKLLFFQPEFFYTPTLCLVQLSKTHDKSFSCAEQF